MDPRRAVRRDLGGIGAAVAIRVLTECAPAIEAEVRRLRPSLRHVQGLDEDDLRSLGQIAALEAYLTHADGRGRTLRSWAGQVVRWRLVEAVQAAQAPDEHVMLEGDEVEVDPTLDYERAEQISWLHRTVGTLPPRMRVLVAARLSGQSQGAAGRTLGIGDTRVSQEVGAAVVALHAAALDAGLVDG